MSSPPAPQGNEHETTSPDPPTSFGYSQPYPAPRYPFGPEQDAAPSAAPERAPATGKAPSWPTPAGKLVGVAAVVLLVVVLAVLSWTGWLSRIGPDLAIRPPASTPQGSVADRAAAAAVDAWLRGGGQLVIDNLAADYRRVAAATAANDLGGLEPACTALRGSAETAQAYPPIPDPEAQVHWSASLAQSARSGTDCLAGLTANHLELVMQAGHEAGASSRESALMNARIGALRGN
jgi:hypothetical protein